MISNYLSTLSPVQLEHVLAAFRPVDPSTGLPMAAYEAVGPALAGAMRQEIAAEQAARTRFAEELEDFGTDSLEEYAQTLVIQAHSTRLPTILRNRAGMQLGMVRDAIAKLKEAERVVPMLRPERKPGLR